MGSLKLIGEQEGGRDDHAALTNLDFASAGHTGFVASDGVAGGQTVKGGTGASENLTLQSTDDATRGVIDIIDSLRLTGNSVQDSGGNPRITLAPSSPHVTLTGRLKVTDHACIGPDSPDDWTGLKVRPSISSAVGATILAATPVSLTAEPYPVTRDIRGIQGVALANIQSGATVRLKALDFLIGGVGAGTVTDAYMVYVRTMFMSYSGPAFNIHGIYVEAPYMLLSTAPTDIYGVHIPDQGAPVGAYPTNIAAIRVLDQTTVTGSKYLLELGPSTPYLRLVGGANPGANQTNLYLNEGGNLRHAQVKDGATIGAGDRVMVLV